MGLWGAVGFASGGAQKFVAERDGVELLLSERYPDRVLELMASAKKKIWVSMYVARYQEDRSFAIENKMFKALVDAYRRGVDVKVILDEGMEWDTHKGRMSNRRSQKNDEALQYLRRNGVPVRLDDPERIMHAKTLSVDDQYAVVGSHNWTYSALKKNVEVSVILSRKQDAEPLARAFDEMWRSCPELE